MTKIDPVAVVTVAALIILFTAALARLIGAIL
jgi:hypothetical protein